MLALKKYLAHVSFGNVLCLLLFMYPLFATVVRHWNSTIFGFVTLLGLIYFFTRRRKDALVLDKYEKIFLWLLAGNFFVFLLTSLLNLPEDIKEIRFDIELRFLLIIPLYFLLIKAGTGFKCLAYGAIISVFIAFGYCIHYVVIEGRPEFDGIYSRLYTGPIILIYATLSIGYLLGKASSKHISIWLLIIAIILAAGFAIATTHARIAYIAFLIVAIQITGFYSKINRKLLSTTIVVALILIVGYLTPQIKHRAFSAYQEFSTYLQLSESDKRISAGLTSVGTRLEMWRAAPLVLRDHTFFGVGNGNYNMAMQVYIDNNELNPAVNHHSHAHNVFVNVLILKGLLGLVITCLVLFFPLYIYIKTFRRSPHSASMGILFVSLIFLISMNETAPFVKSNFVATFLLISLVIFQNHMQHIKRVLHD